jgi:hypothetical protein
VIEKILGRLDPLGGKQLRHARPHAAHIHHWSIEAGHRTDAKWLAPRETNRPVQAPILQYAPCIVVSVEIPVRRALCTKSIAEVF